MITTASLNNERRLDIRARIRREGEISFVFTNEEGQDLYLVYDEFRFFVQKNPGSREFQIDYDTDDTTKVYIENLNEVWVTLSETDTNIEEGQYYWELLMNNKTLLNGYATFYNGVFDGVLSPEQIELLEGDINITITQNL